MDTWWETVFDWMPDWECCTAFTGLLLDLLLCWLTCRASAPFLRGYRPVVYTACALDILAACTHFLIMMVGIYTTWC